MGERVIDVKVLEAFEVHLRDDEKSEATIEKYMRDVKAFTAFAKNRCIDKALVIDYKTFLSEKHAVRSANSMIAAINAFFRFVEWFDCCVKQYKVQRQAFCPEEKELTRAEYIRLVNAAKKEGNKRLDLIIQTICATGIRVSELQYITMEAVIKGEAVVSCKGKTRKIFIVPELRKQLLKYAQKQGITAGMIFITRSGKPVSRCNIWREMKSLCNQANVAPGKVFPHNLRHLFARTFYNIEKDIAKLADILGHTSINTTRIYTITTGAEHKRKMENMHLII